MYQYAARVVRVIDADTVVLDIDLGLRTWRHSEYIRLLGLNAPERGTEAGTQATAWLREMLPVGTLVRLVTRKDQTEKYGRWLGVLWRAQDGNKSINGLLVETAHAVPWDGQGPRP